MKIALVNKFYPPIVGGIEHHIRLLANRLQDISDIEKIEILVANNHYKFQQEKLSDKIIVSRLPNIATIQSTPIAPALIEWFKKVDVDLFHFHFPYPFADLAWLLSQVKKPYLVTYHSDIVRQKILGMLYEPFMHAFLKRAKRIIVQAPQMMDSSLVLQRYRNKIDVVPTGIEPSPFELTSEIHDASKIINAEYSLGKPLILFIGRLVYYKGVEVLIKAMKNIEASLLIVGTGTLEQPLKDLTCELNISDKVHFCTRVSDELLPAYYHASDIFVLPSISKTEAYGLVQLEAHACAKPVISTDLGTGVSFVNKHNLSGLIVPPNDVDALANALALLIQNKELSARLGKQAKEQLLKEFTATSMARRIAEVYRTILQGEMST